MASDDDWRFETQVETNRWESFTRLTFSYFADQDYDFERRLEPEVGKLKLAFTDDDRSERAEFVYEGSPPDMAQESLQQMQKLLQESTSAAKLWTEMLRSSRD